MSRELFSSLISGCRSSLSRSITIVESQKPSQLRRDIVKYAFEHHLKTQPKTVRMAISGGPGAGKSSFIETFGMRLIEKHNRKIAVLAVDPSSAITGGSLLADKTRMTNLSRNQNAYIRPSPNRGQSGGVTRSTGEAILLCESAGYDFILIETVGVGQSEYAVSDLCDVFALLVAPSGGDEIQAIKKGIVELANIIVVTKSDGDLTKHARKMSAEFISATKFINIGKKPFVKRCSAHTGDGIDDVYECVRQLTDDHNELMIKRRDQRIKLLKTYLFNAILEKLDSQINLKHYEQLLKNDDSLLIWDIIDEIIQKL